MRTIKFVALVSALFVAAMQPINAQQGLRSTMERAEELLKAEKYEAAIDGFRQVLEAVPNDLAANYDAGFCYYKLKQYERAVPAFRNAIRSKPDFVDAYVYLGNSLDYLGRYKEALDSYIKASSLAPDKADIFFEIGVAHSRQKNNGQAVVAFERCLKLDPNHLDALYNLGTTLADSGRMDEARPYLERFVSEAPPARYGSDLARLRRRLGR